MLVSTEVSYSFTVTENRNLVANFSVLGTTPTGGVSGMFSVSNGQQVYFSQGNLQYIGSAGNGDENNTGAYWKFAEHQWDVLGDNGQGSDTLLLVDRDLFGWGTSGYEHGAVNYQPWTTAMNVSQSAYYYYAYGCNNCNLFDESGMADWGYNAILNGGNTENSGWRTPTHEEYEYLLNTRSTVSDIRYAKAQVNGINGLVLLPDSWNRSYYVLNNTNLSNVDFSSNIITLEQWSTLEQHGAVFLPAAGHRSGTTISYLQEGNYWSASSYSQMSAYRLRITNSDCYVNSNRRGYGQSVRLVRSIHTYCINASLLI